MTATLALHVPTRPMLVAGRLRAAFERRGFTVLPRATTAPLSGFRIALVPAGPSATWIHTDVNDALPDELGRLLSQDLRAVVTTIGAADDVIAVELADAGRVRGQVTLRGTEILDGELPEWSMDLQRADSMEALLVSKGLGEFRRGFDEVANVPGVLVLGFAPKAGEGEVIEIDPSLSCPICGEAMRQVTGPHGVFFGCVRYPTCKGRLTEKQAATHRGQ